MKIILASASPRRRELLAQIGLDFEIRVSHMEEKTSESEPARMVQELAAEKAEAVLELTEYNGEDVLVIGADTVVALEGSILGKPMDEGQAVEMLRSLSGKTHEVYTGVALLFRSGSGRETAVRRKVFHEATKVTFYPLKEEEIAAYVAGGECMDKAGSYGIQGVFARYVRSIDGDYNNVVGLPVSRLYQEAKEWMGW